MPAHEPVVVPDLEPRSEMRKLETVRWCIAAAAAQLGW
jgi:hypothetical protein